MKASVMIDEMAKIVEKFGLFEREKLDKKIMWV